eukprot:scaffold8037_cov66-Phaeocystis_antarctica.AAC.1
MCGPERVGMDALPCTLPTLDTPSQPRGESPDADPYTPVRTPTTPTTNTPDRPTPIHPHTRTVPDRYRPEWGEPTVIGAPHSAAPSRRLPSGAASLATAAETRARRRMVTL